ncbi:membrane protein [Mycobacterium phage ScoobyDoobyDoo]|nr:membrane protein [Mycobacterium phage ScoobyDoobyDoo]
MGVQLAFIVARLLPDHIGSWVNPAASWSWWLVLGPVWIAVLSAALFAGTVMFLAACDIVVDEIAERRRDGR